MEELEEKKLIEAGKIAGQALQYAKSLVKPGIKILEVCEKTEEKIKQLGGELAFPPQIALNDVAAHFCPDLNDETEFTDQIVSIDVGVHKEGNVGGDTALSIDLSGKHSELIKASKEALKEAIKIIKIGTPIGEIGKTIHEIITSYGYSPIRNLSGHGLNWYSIHTKPSIPNYDNKDPTTLKEGDLIAIEPFASTGAGIVYESSPGTLFQLLDSKPVRNMITRKILKDIESYHALPFCKRWLVKKHGEAKTNYALRELKTLEILREYPPLIDQKHGLVSQAEHTVLVKEKPIILTKGE